MIIRIHAQGNYAKGHNHPDARAIMYESKTYSKRKIQDFISALEGFEQALKIVDSFGGTTALYYQSSLQKYYYRLISIACFQMWTVICWKDALNEIPMVIFLCLKVHSNTLRSVGGTSLRILVGFFLQRCIMMTQLFSDGLWSRRSEERRVHNTETRRGRRVRFSPRRNGWNKTGSQQISGRTEKILWSQSELLWHRKETVSNWGSWFSIEESYIQVRASVTAQRLQALPHRWMQSEHQFNVIKIISSPTEHHFCLLLRQEFLARQIAAENNKDKVLKDISRRIFAKFSEKYDMWCSAVYQLATLDVLTSFAQYSLSGEMSVPVIEDASDDKKVGILFRISNV